MGFFDKLRGKKSDSFLGLTDASGTTAAELGALGQTLQDQLLAQSHLLQDLGAMAMCRSPVLALRDGAVVQPAAMLARPMLDRFWSGAGRDTMEEIDLGPLVGRLAEACAASDELARAALSEIDAFYLSREAPVSPWPSPDRRLRLVSLVLADVVRKLAAGMSSGEVGSSYGLSRSGENDASARTKVEALRAEEAAWMRAAMDP